MADNKEIVIQVDIDTNGVVTRLAEATKEVERLKKEQGELTKKYKEGSISVDEYVTSMASNKKEMDSAQRTIKSHTAALQAQSVSVDKDTMSLDEQRHILLQMQKAYAGLSGEAKATADAEGGLASQIKQLTDSLKEQEHAIGDNRRNVGNYTESIIQAADHLGPMKGLLEGVAGGSTKMSVGFDRADKVAKGLMKNPMWGTFFLLGGILSTIVDALKKNDDAMKGIQVTTAGIGASFDKVLKPMLKWLEKFLVENLLKAIDWVVEAIKATLGWIDKIAKKFGKDLGLVDAFEAGAIAAQEETKVVEEETKKQIEARKKAEEELAKQREEMAKRKRTDLENELHDLEEKCKHELEVVGLTEEEKEEIRQYYDDLKRQKEADAEAELEAEMQKELEKIEEQERKKMEARQKALLDFGLEEGETLEQKELRLLQEAREQDLINAEEYEIAKTIITEKYSKKRQEEIDQEIEAAKKAYESAAMSATSSAGAAMSALSDLCGEFAETSEEAAAAQKAFAFGSILINQAMSIAAGAKGIAEAMAGAAAAAAATGPAAPFMLPVFTAQMVGEVLAMVASVASTIVQSKQIFAQADKFSTGTLLPGRFDGKDDIPAMLSHGEMVLNPQQASNALWNMANQPPMMTGYSYELMAAAMTQAVAAMPAPSLALTELADAQSRVSTYNEIASI